MPPGRLLLFGGGGGGSSGVTEVRRANLDFIAGDQFIDTGWAIPQSGAFIIQINNALNNGLVTTSPVLDAVDMRALPVSTVNGNRVANADGTIKFVLFPNNDGISVGFHLARTSANNLLIAATFKNQRPYAACYQAIKRRR